MDIGLGVAGFICLAMAFGHTMIGIRWILPGITEENVPKTPFGPHSMSVAMVRVTWFIVTIFVLGIAGLLLSLAWDAPVDPKPLMLRWLAATWLAAAGMALWNARRSLRHLWRLPVPLLWVVVGVICWVAST